MFHIEKRKATPFNWSTIVTLINRGNLPAPWRVEKSKEEWKDLLSDEVYLITREHATEPAYSSTMCQLFSDNTYGCACCGTPLFSSTKKYQSGFGWPSFTQPIILEHLAYHKDTRYGMIRVEVLCNICDAHLGHVFPDGPDDGGLRYCINALSLRELFV